MNENFEPCDFVENEDGFNSLCFSDFEEYCDFSDLLESEGGQGGGYSWEAIIKAVMSKRNLSLPDLDFDPESDMFCVVSDNTKSLEIVASIVKELCADQSLMAESIKIAKQKGYFE